MNLETRRSTVVKIALLGAAGRMGRIVMRASREYPGVQIGAALVPADSPLLGQEAGEIRYSCELDQALAGCDVLVDFSTPAATAIALEACVMAGRPLITGVTGLTGALDERLTVAGQSIPVLAAPNMSLGAVLLQALVYRAAAALGEGYAVEIKDRHHRHKKDAPSGTALALGAAVAAGFGVPLKERMVLETSVASSAPQPGAIHFVSIRRGEIIGDHSVSFLGDAETLELTHRAHDRATFALGALSAARWICGQPAGRYHMHDVLDMDAC